MTQPQVELELFNEISPQKVNFYTVNAGREATANKAIFFVGAWRMSQLKPWTAKPFEVETGEVDSWADWKLYLSSTTGFSVSNIDDMVDRIDYLVSINANRLDIVDAIVRFPMAIDDLRDGPETVMPVAELVSELTQLPNGAEARKRVMKEQGVNWFRPIGVAVFPEHLEVDVSEMDGDTELNVSTVTMNTTGVEDWTPELSKWLASKFKVRRKREDS